MDRKLAGDDKLGLLEVGEGGLRRASDVPCDLKVENDLFREKRDL